MTDLEALIVVEMGWSGTAQGPDHKVYVQACNQLRQARRQIVNREVGPTCPHCGEPLGKEKDVPV